MSPIQHDLSETRESLTKRAPPVSQKTISILIGSCVTLGVIMLATITVALFRWYFRRRKRENHSQAIVDDPRSPVDSFIQRPPPIVETPISTSDAQPNHQSTPSLTFSCLTDQEELDAVAKGSSGIKSKQYQDSETEAPHLTSTYPQADPRHMLVGLTHVNGAFDHPYRPESLTSIYSTASLSPTQESSISQSHSEEPLKTNPSFVIRASPSVTEADVYPEPRTEHGESPRRQPKKVVDFETISSRRSISNTRLTYHSIVIPPNPNSNFKQSRPLPGLPSSPASPLTWTRIVSQDVVPSQALSPLHDPYTSQTFLNSPPQRRMRLESHGKGHLRSLSHSAALSRKVEHGRSQMETSDSTRPRRYASVAYAREKAMESAGPRARSVTSVSATSRAPQRRARPKTKDHTFVERYSRKSEKEVPSLLSSRPRSQPRPHSWSAIGGEAPESI